MTTSNTSLGSMDPTELSNVTADDCKLLGYNTPACEGPTRKETMTALAAALGPLSMGFVIGYCSPTVLVLEEQGFLQPGQDAWYGSVANLGMLCGGLFSGWLMDTLGRKLTIMLSAMPFVAGWICILSARDFTLLCCGRILTGLGTGLILMYTPYVAETSPKQTRGAFGMIYQISTNLGITLTFALSFLLDWQWLAVACAVPPTLMLLAMLGCPESPSWLLKEGRCSEALQTLSLLRNCELDDPNLKKEFEEMLCSIRAHQPEFHPSQLWQLRRQILIAVVLAVLVQFSGHNGMLYYTETLFRSAGYQGRPGIPSLVFGGTITLMSTISGILVDRLGRKPMLVTAAMGMVITLSTMAIYFNILHTTPSTASTISWLPLVCIAINALSYGLGWGAIPPLVISEIFPLHMRSFGNTLFMFLANLLSFIVILTFLPLQGLITPQGIFWFYAIDCLLAAVFCGLVLKETSGISLTQIQVEVSERSVVN